MIKAVETPNESNTYPAKQNRITNIANIWFQFTFLAKQTVTNHTQQAKQIRIRVGWSNLWSWRRIWPGTASRTRPTTASVLPTTHSENYPRTPSHHIIDRAHKNVYWFAFAWYFLPGMCMPRRNKGSVVQGSLALLDPVSQWGGALYCLLIDHAHSITGAAVRSGRAGRPAARWGPCREECGPTWPDSTNQVRSLH